MRVLTACAVLFVAARACFLPAIAAEPPARYAILVGIDEYDHPKLGALKYAAADASELGALLAKSDYKVTLLSDAEGQKDGSRIPTKVNIESAFRGVLKSCRAGDTVIVAFAGHGLQFEEDKDAFFCPKGAKPYRDEKETLVSLGSLYYEMEKSLAGVKILLVDACRNDPTAGRGTRGGIDADNAPAPPKGVAALFSCSNQERAFELEEYKHGLFFHHVIEGLKGKAANASRRVTFNSLADYVPEMVERDAIKRVGQGARQSPNQKADLRGASPVLLTLKDTANPDRSPVPARKEIETAKEITSKTLPSLKLVRIRAGKFTMGSPTAEKDRSNDELEHEVTLTKDYYLGVDPVTVGQWRAFQSAAGYDAKAGAKPSFDQGDDHPVVNVSWEDAQAFCKWLGGKDGREYRLPTEAEWEYGCRGGTKTAYWFGDAITKADANFGFNESSTTPVGKYKANAYELRDMHGNVWQWCSDRYGSYPSGSVADPPGVESGSDRVLRGGSWNSFARNCRSAYRSRSGPSLRYRSYGFRLSVSIR